MKVSISKMYNFALRCKKTSMLSKLKSVLFEMTYTSDYTKIRSDLPPTPTDNKENNKLTVHEAL